MSDSPSKTEGYGRGANGRFAAGNKLAKGNPYAKKIARIRAALMQAADPKRIKVAVEKLLEAAEKGDRQALSEILDRTIGKPVAADLLERIEAIEAALEAQNERAKETR